MLDNFYHNSNAANKIYTFCNNTLHNILLLQSLSTKQYKM